MTSDNAAVTAFLFSSVGKALFGERFKAPLAYHFGLKPDNVDDMSKGRSRIPAGIWYGLIGLLRERQALFPNLEEQALAVVDVARHRPIQVDTNGTYIIRNGATEVFRGPLPAARDWLDRRQAEALLTATKRQHSLDFSVECPDGIADARPMRFRSGLPPEGATFQINLQGSPHQFQMVAHEDPAEDGQPKRLVFMVDGRAWFAGREAEDDVRFWLIGGRA